LKHLQNQASAGKELTDEVELSIDAAFFLSSYPSFHKEKCRDVVLERPRSWSRDRSRPEFCSLGLGLEGTVTAVFETYQ